MTGTRDLRQQRHRMLRLSTRAFVQVAFYLVLIVFAVVDLFPYIWVLLNSFKSQLEIFAFPPTGLPLHPITDNYMQVFGVAPPGQQPISAIPSGLTNSIEIDVVTTIAVVIIAALAGYAFAKLRFPGRGFLLVLLLTLRMLPSIVLVVPLFILASNTHTFDTKLGLCITYSAFNLPFAVWLLSVFFQEVPQELDEAARVDGCSRFSVLYRIYVPLSLPALATIAILVFLNAWNEFLFAVVLTSSSASATAPVALAAMQSAFDTRFSVMTAGAIVQTLPAVIIVIFAQRYIIRGLTLGAVKG